MGHKIITRKYQPNDARDLANIYYHTIHNINCRDYSKNQINAWAPTSSLELDDWQKKWAKIIPVVALYGDKIVGFAEFESNGHIGCFYVHHNFQGRGVGSALIFAIEIEAKKNNIHRICAEVSLTARLFFERKGFHIIKKQMECSNVMVRGCKLTNFVMEKIYHFDDLLLRTLNFSDIPIMVNAFAKLNWAGKTTSTFEQYFYEQQKQERMVWVAFLRKQFAGYVTLRWESKYLPFKENNIPEIIDLNVMLTFRKSGIGTILLDEAEKTASSRSKTVGIGVGLYSDYGSAQKLYVNRNYIPNSKGATYKYESVIPGNSYPLDDDLVLWFTKKLRYK